MEEAKRDKLKEEIRKRLDKLREQRAQMVTLPPPRYDDVFFEGVAWLDKQ